MSSQGRVLIVEDEKDISDLMSLHLKRAGFVVTAVDNGEEALRLLEGTSFQVLVVDWMLPGLSGVDLCRKLRALDPQNSVARVPVLMVTARASTADIVTGLESGADDYLTKPFDSAVFLARVQALLRRVPAPTRSARLQIGNLVLDPESHTVMTGNHPVQLTQSEFKLLATLMRNAGRVLTRAQLMAQVQGDGVNVTERTIDTHVFSLRKKLKNSTDVIETIRGIGYRVKSKD